MIDIDHIKKYKNSHISYWKLSGIYTPCSLLIELNMFDPWYLEQYKYQRELEAFKLFKKLLNKL